MKFSYWRLHSGVRRSPGSTVYQLSCHAVGLPSDLATPSRLYDAMLGPVKVHTYHPTTAPGRAKVVPGSRKVPVLRYTKGYVLCWKIKLAVVGDEVCSICKLKLMNKKG